MNRWEMPSANTGADAVSLRNMALVGRARTRLDMGKLAEAAADARLVPAGFVRNAEFSTANQNRENRIFNMTVTNRFISVTPAYQALTVNGQPDPRVRAQNMNVLGQDGATPYWLTKPANRPPMPESCTHPGRRTPSMLGRGVRTEISLA